MRDLLGSADDSDEPAALVAGELAQRLQQLEAGARTLRAECRENAKTLDAAEAELVKQVTARSPAPPLLHLPSRHTDGSTFTSGTLQMEGSDAQWDVSGVFGPAGGGAAAVPPGPAPATEDQEDYYLAVSLRWRAARKRFPRARF